MRERLLVCEGCGEEHYFERGPLKAWNGECPILQDYGWIEE